MFMEDLFHPSESSWISSTSTSAPSGNKGLFPNWHAWSASLTGSWTVLGGTSTIPNFWVMNPRFSPHQLAFFGSQTLTINRLTSNLQSQRTWEWKILKIRYDGISTDLLLRSLMKSIMYSFPLPC